MRELIEALDKRGRPTGKLKTKLEIFNDGDWRDVIHVWIIDSQYRLLVQKRAHKGLWDDLLDISVGGGVSAGEKPLDCAARELYEELGIKVSSSEHEKLGVWETSKPLPEKNLTAREFSHTFLQRREIKISQLKLNPGEVVSVKWLSLDDLAKIIQGADYKFWMPHPKNYYYEVIKIIKTKQ